MSDEDWSLGDIASALEVDSWASANFRRQPPSQGAYPPQPGYGQPPYQASQQQFPPTPASLGYGPPQQIGWDGTAAAEAIRKAMKGFGTDEKALIKNLADKDPLQVEVLRRTYNQRFSRHMLNDVQGETSGWFEEGLCAIIRGPLQQDVVLLHSAMDGPGTKEKVLNDILLGRSNTDLRAIKDLYKRTYHTSLESDIKSDLSMKTERHFMMVVAANRTEETAPIIPQQIDSDVMELYKATEGKVGTDELLVCSILSQRSDAQIKAIAYAYQQKFTRYVFPRRIFFQFRKYRQSLPIFGGLATRRALLYPQVHHN